MKDPLLSRIKKASVVHPRILDSDKVLSQAQAKLSIPRGLTLAISTSLVVTTVIVGLLTLPHGGTSGLAQPGKPLFTVESHPRSVGSAYMVNMPMGPLITYTAGEELSKKPSTGKVFKLVKTGDPHQILLNLANVYQVQGEIVEPSDSDPNEYIFTNGAIPTEPSIGLTWFGTGAWSVDLYEQGRSHQRKEFPSDEEIKRQASSFFAQTGLLIRPEEVDLYKDSGRRAIGHLKVDGLPIDLTWEVNWDESGNLQSATGHSVVPQEVGEFETISEVDAVSRITKPGYFGSVADSLTNFHRSWPILMRAKIPKNVICNKADRVPMIVWDMKGNAWVTPGYVFENSQTYWWPAVSSLADGLITIPPTMPSLY